ncbi:hypothetical protein [Verrucomicrobium spinosum]|uniref:hypothetical protein n=1 Tax=Verrucomicrobium spinosum TaxID=2736 RepID=UPI001E419BB6|nr:hypothetical protein [Verrucomicrobium spinosum]
MKKFARGAERDALLRLAERKAGKSLVVRGLAGAASVAAQTATGTLSRVLDRTVTDLGTQGVQVTQNDLDQYVAHIDATERPGSVWSAFGKAFRYQFMENTSEKLGSVFSALGGEQAVKQAMRGLSEPMKAQLGKHALFLAIAKANPGKKLEAVQKMLARANVDGLHAEVLEEGGSAALHYLFDGEEFHLPSVEDVASLFVTMLMTGTVMKVANWRDGKGKTESHGTPLGQALREPGETAASPQQATLAAGASAQAPVQAGAGGITAEGTLQGSGGLGAAGEGQAAAGVEATAVTGGAVQPRLSFSQGSRTPGSWFMELAQDWRRFLRKGPTESKDLGQIVAHHQVTPNEATVKELGYGVMGHSGITFAIQAEAGGEAYVLVQRGKVWVDTSSMRADDPSQPRQGGDLVYQSAMTYARNNGLQFVPDPMGVKPIARRRRISQMLSSALRYRSTQHLSPQGYDPDTQTAYDEVPGWRSDNSEGAYKHNVELMAKAELEYVSEEMKQRGLDIDDLHYDQTTDTVWRDSTRQRLSQGDFDALVARLDPRNSGVGATTLSRALVTRSALEGHDRGRDSQEHRQAAEVDGGGEVSEDPGRELFRLLGPDADPNEIFYSRQQGNNLEDSAPGAHPVQRTGVTQAEVDEALKRLRTLPEAAGLTDSLLIVGNRQELDGKDGRPGEADYQPDEWAGIETAEGFIDTKTGGAVVLRDQVEVREGETPAMAVARVVMHERVGHGGVNALLGTEPKFQKKWDKASALIPAAELQSLRQKYPELTDRPADLALEWLAHQTGDRMSSQSFKPGSAAAEMWQTLKDYVAKIMHTVSGGKMMSDAALDAYVRDMISGARRMVKNGQASGGNASVNGATVGSVNGTNGTASAGRLSFSNPKGSTGAGASASTESTDPASKAEDPPPKAPYVPKGAQLDLSYFPASGQVKTDEEIDHDYDADMADSADRRRRKHAGETGLVLSHYIERHGEQVTDQQLKDRCILGHDPITGTDTDGDHGATHKFSRHATKFATRRSLIAARNAILNSQEYADALADPVVERMQFSNPVA